MIQKHTSTQELYKAKLKRTGGALKGISVE